MKGEMTKKCVQIEAKRVNYSVFVIAIFYSTALINKKAN